MDSLAKYGPRGSLRYLAVSISLPGYGGSTGPEDFAGSYTQHAVAAVIRKLEKDREVDPDRIVIEGISLGAVTGALVAAHMKKLAGIVLISGLYDLPNFLAQPKSLVAWSLKANAYLQTGGGEAALRDRSALLIASSITASTLILNGAKDDRTDPDQARRLAESIVANGGEAKVHIYPEYGHEIPVSVRQAEIDTFIDGLLKH